MMGQFRLLVAVRTAGLSHCVLSLATLFAPRLAGKEFTRYYRLGLRSLITT